MRIGLVSPYDFPYPGGVTKHINNLSRAFRQRGHEAIIIAASSDAAPAQAAAASQLGFVRLSTFIVPIRFNRSVARIGLSPLLARRVRRLLRQSEFDVLHVHEPAIPALPWVVLRQAQVVCSQTALVGTFHASDCQRDRHWFSSLALICLRPVMCQVVDGLDGRIAVSPAARAFASAYHPGPFRVIPNGVDTALFGSSSLQPLPQFSEGLNVLFVGRLEPRKGVSVLLEAYARLKERLPSARLLMAGPYAAGERASVERATARLRLSDVHLVGQLPDEELARYYRSSHLLCAPSVGGESFGMVLLEAMAAGLPIVASDIEGYRSVMRHRREGLLVPAGDSVALAGSLAALLEDPPLRRAMGERGRDTAARYRWEGVADQVLEYYGDLVARKRGTNPGWRNP